MISCPDCGTGILIAEPTDDDLVQHVGWGGTTRTVHTEMDLGRGVWRTPDYGIRRALWDAAFGYVSGFRKRDILYYVLTRSLSSRVEARVIAAEQARTRGAEPREGDRP